MSPQENVSTQYNLRSARVGTSYAKVKCNPVEPFGGATKPQLEGNFVDSDDEASDINSRTFGEESFGQSRTGTLPLPGARQELLKGQFGFANAVEQLAAYPVCQAGLKLVEQLLRGAAWVPPSLPLLPAPAAATVSNSLNQLARSARVTRRAGMRREADEEGFLISSINSLLDLANLRVKSIAKKKVSFKAQQEVFRRDSTCSSSSGCDDSFDYAEELDNSALDKDPDFIPTSEIVQAEAGEDNASIEIEYLSEDRDCRSTQVERELGEEHNRNSFRDDELSSDMHRNLEEHSYSQANLEVVSKDMFTKMECTRNAFLSNSWKAVCSEVQERRTEGNCVQMMDSKFQNDVGEKRGEERQTAWRPGRNIGEGPLTPSEDASECLLDISQEDPAVLACGNVLPPSIMAEVEAADIEQEMNHVEVVYEAGFCLPRLIVKEEVQEEEDVTADEEKEHGATVDDRTPLARTADISASSSLNAEEVLSACTQDVTMMMAALKAKQGILNMMEEEKREVSTKQLLDEGAELAASLAVEVGSAIFPGEGALFPDGVGFPGGAMFPGSVEMEEGLEFGVSVSGGDMDEFMAGIDFGESLPEPCMIMEPLGPELESSSIEIGASCTGGDINSLLSQIESMGLQG